MAKSECRCQHYSCESLLLQENGKVVLDPETGKGITDPHRRFRFIKDDTGSICDGGIVDGCIADCEIKIRDKNNLQKENNVIEIDPEKIQQAINKEIKKVEKKRKKHRRQEYRQRQNLIS